MQFWFSVLYDQRKREKMWKSLFNDHVIYHGINKNKMPAIKATSKYKYTKKKNSNNKSDLLKLKELP